jgi:molecular chaperone DnaK
VTIRVFQGEREMAQDNKMLGNFDLLGLPPAPRGVPQIEVTFDIDANGIVNVQAKDKATQKEQQIRIQASGGLSDSDIQKMVKDAEAHAAEDKKRRAVVEARNHADATIHGAEKQLKEGADKVSADDKAAVESAIADLKSVLDSEDADAIKAKTDAVMQALIKVGEAMYKNAGGAEGAAPGSDGGAAGGDGAGGASGEDEKVVDADFEEVDERKGKSA